MPKPTIGLEVHVQLRTDSKMFCACPMEFGAEPNTRVCPVCLALPGSLPVLNRVALESTIALGLALHCHITPFSQFHRKNYFYPDLPKGYQISQYDLPLASDGYLTLPKESIAASFKKVGIIRVHMEEDTAKSIHGASLAHNVGYALLDFNRSGVPLLEVVSAPDLESPEEASAYLVELRAILRTLGISSGNMEEGALRCDVNISLDRGTRAEVKNLNSFRAVRKALEYEFQRQCERVERGEAVLLETRHWDEAKGVTIPGRSKEEAEDYRYFPEPDLLPLEIDVRWVEQVHRSLPELPEGRRERLASLGLHPSEAITLAHNPELACFFDGALEVGAPPKETANWLLGEVQRILHAGGKSLEETPLTPVRLAELLRLIQQGVISSKGGKALLEVMLTSDRPPAELVEALGLAQVSDPVQIRLWVQEAIAANPKQSEQYRQGKEALLAFFAGQVMKKSFGNANPELLDRILKEELQATA
ncbi:MAG: Asp-tRNA(Asn)/Glu-tRNA(Gln) amidotransferase subunit GatB [Coprothermobacterota bacterium]|nr:Asp-tRNA(Asn)/Glu-tRNA(Gln) amidotransferase subunit GatB [Coprothermobacterota bacterium]